MNKQQLNFNPGFIVNDKYEILDEIGRGYEGCVFLVREIHTNIERTIKFFFPQKNKKNKTIHSVAKKLHALRSSRLLIQYHTVDYFVLKDGTPVSFLVSEFTQGLMLSDFIKEHSGQRIHYYMAIHLLYSLVKGIEEVHRLGEYHADIHSENIMIERVGLSFQLKLLDPFHWVGATRRDGQKDDIVNVIEVFYEMIGGHKHYYKQPKFIKDICCGMKKTFILKKFKTITRLRVHIENMSW
jgi:serine/threonine protein kinase